MVAWTAGEVHGPGDKIPRDPRNGGQPDTSGWPGPLRRFADRLDEVRSAEIFDMDQVGRVLVELAADEEFFDPSNTSGWSRSYCSYFPDAYPRYKARVKALIRS